MAAAGVIPLAMAWIGDAVPYEQRQATLAQLLTGTLSGMMAGQLAGGLFGDSALGWRGAFFTLSAGYLVVALSLLILLRSMRSAPSTLPPARLDFVAQLRSVLHVPWARVVLAAVHGRGHVPAGAHGLPARLPASAPRALAVGGIGTDRAVCGGRPGLRDHGAPARAPARRAPDGAGRRRDDGCGLPGVVAVAAVGAGRAHRAAGGLRHLPVPQHAADPCDPDGAVGAGHRGGVVRFLPVRRPGHRRHPGGLRLRPPRAWPLLLAPALALPLAGWGFARALRSRGGE